MSIWLRVLTSLGIFRIVLLTSNSYRLQMVSQGDDGAYDFAYDTGEGNYHIQSRNPNGTITGKFAYLSPDGMLREIGYTADDNGFRPEGDLHPPPPALWNQGKKKNSPSPQIPNTKTEQVRTHDRRHLETPKIKQQLPVHPPVLKPPEAFPFPNAGPNADFLSGPLPRKIDASTTPGSVPLTSNLPFSLAPLLSSGNIPVPNKRGFNGQFIDGNIKSPDVSQPKAVSTLLSALAHLTEIDPSTSTLPKELPQPQPNIPRETSQQQPNIPLEPINVPELPRPQSPSASSRSAQSSRLRQVRLKLLQLITLLEEMEDEPNHALKSRSLNPLDSSPPPEKDSSNIPQLPVSSPIIPEDLNKFPSSSDIVVRKTPELETPLFTPVDGVRQIGGQRILEREYIPLTRRYGYVYSQQN